LLLLIVPGLLYYESVQHLHGGLCILRHWFYSIFLRGAINLLYLPYTSAFCCPRFLLRELQRTTRNYLTSCQMFRNADSTRQVRRAVDTFLERVARDNEHLAASGMPLQPSLDPLEAASIVNLGLFDIEELFRVLPTVRDKFAVHREGLQDLLSAMESFQRDA